MSSYIINREPHKYGSQQLDYIQRTNAIVAETAHHFREALTTNKNLIELFHHTLAQLGERRHQIAVEHKTDNSQYFGVRQNSCDLTAVFLTPLHLCYADYNEKLIQVLQKNLGSMNHTIRTFDQTELKITEKKCLGRNFSTEYKIITYEDSNLHTLTFSEDEFKRIASLSSYPISNKLFEEDDFRVLSLNKDAMQKLKQTSINDYKRLKNSLNMQTIKMKFEGRKSDWALVTLRSEIDGKMYALSQYLTWLNRDFRNDPVENMKDLSIVTIVHQDPFLIDTMLTDIAKIFKQCLECRSEELKLLKDLIALFQYELAHAMPFKRGSAAISEWLEMAIYHFHGYEITYNENKLLNLEALTSTLGQFVENYDSMIQLKKI